MTSYVTEERFDAAIYRLEKLIYSFFTTFKEAHDSHFALTKDIQQHVLRIEDRVENIEEILFPLVNAEEKDAIASISHERRITRLEKRAGFHPEPPAHLSDLPTLT